MKPKTVTYKSWCLAEASKARVSPKAIMMRVKRGKYPSLRRHWLNARIVVVEV